MRLTPKLDEWRSAGLIDGETIAAIRAHEEGRHRPVALFAIVGLGLLALALGILSLVAANWDELPRALKLAAHLAMMAGTAIAAYLLARTDRVWAGEGALFMLAALTLAGIALHGQVYQLTGPLWHALGWWALFISPAILALGRTRLTAYGYAAMLAALAIAYRSTGAGFVGDNLSAALPVALVFLALASPRDGRNASFRTGLLEIGLGLTLIAASIAHLAWSSRVSNTDAWQAWASAPLAVLIVAGASILAFRSRPRAEAELLAMLMTGSLTVVLLAFGLSHGDGPAARFVGMASFLLLWSGIAVMATRAEWHGLFRIAIAALAVRLFLVYFELFYSLAFTGIGLIVGGALLIGLTWVWTRLVRKDGR